MGLSKNSYEKKSELDAYPYEHLLAVGAPDIKFYHTARGLEALCPFHNDKHWAVSASTQQPASGNVSPAEKVAKGSFPSS